MTAAMSSASGAYFLNTGHVLSFVSTECPGRGVYWYIKAAGRYCLMFSPPALFGPRARRDSGRDVRCGGGRRPGHRRAAPTGHAEPSQVPFFVAPTPEMGRCKAP